MPNLNIAMGYPGKDQEDPYANLPPDTAQKLRKIGEESGDPKGFASKYWGSLYIAERTGRDPGAVLNDFDVQAQKYFQGRKVTPEDVYKEGFEFYSTMAGTSKNGWMENAGRSVMEGGVVAGLQANEAGATQINYLGAQFGLSLQNKTNAKGYGQGMLPDIKYTPVLNEQTREKMFQVEKELQSIKGGLSPVRFMKDPTKELTDWKLLTPEKQARYLELNTQLGELRQGMRENIRNVATGEQNMLNAYAKLVGEKRKAFVEWNNIDPEFRNSYVGQVLSGFGQIGFYMSAGWIPVIGPLAMESTLFQEAMDDYRASGGTDEMEGFKYAMAYAIPATWLEFKGLDSIMGRIFKAAPIGGKLTLKQIAMRAAKEAPKAGLVEGGTEPIEGALLDFIAQQSYDEGRDVLFTKEAAQRRLLEAAVGFTVGAGARGGTQTFEDFMTERQRNKAFRTGAGDKVFSKQDFAEARQRLTDEYVRERVPGTIGELFIDGMNGDIAAMVKYNAHVNPLGGIAMEAEEVQKIGPATVYKDKGGHYLVYRSQEGLPWVIPIAEGNKAGERLIAGLKAHAQYGDRFDQWGEEKTSQFMGAIMAQEDVPVVSESSGGKYTAITPDGKSLGEFNTKEEALDAGFEQTIKGAKENDIAIIQRLAKGLSAAQGNRLPYVDETGQPLQTMPDVEQQKRMEQENPGKLEALRNAYRTQHNLDPGAPVSYEELADIVIGGRSVQELYDGTLRWVSHLTSGGDITVPIEEMGESYIKQALELGLVTQDELIEWYRDWLDFTKPTETQLGLPQQYAVNLEGAIEHFGDMLKSRILTDNGEVADVSDSKQLRRLIGPEWFDTFVRKLAAYLRKILEHAHFYTKYQQAGRISESLEAHLSAALGLNEALLEEYDSRQAEMDANYELQAELGLDNETFQLARTGPIMWDARNGIGAVPKNIDVNYFGYEMWITPEEFRKLVPPGVSGLESKEYIKKAVSEGKPIGQPFLNVSWDDKKQAWQVIDHEGRSRADAAADLAPGQPIPVHVLPIDYHRARHFEENPKLRSAPFIPQNKTAPVSVTETYQLQKKISEAQQAILKAGIGNPDENWAATKKYRPTTGLPKNEQLEFAIDLKPLTLGGSKETIGTRPEDWVREQDAWYSKEESLAAADWYHQLHDRFVAMYGEDYAPFMMTACLMAQRNVSPSGALENVYKVLDRIHGLKHGKKGGLSDKTLEALFKGTALEGAIGQKLSDFVDSGYGRTTRTYMGGRPEAGKPFVADIWTGRDAGFVDHATLARLIEAADNGRLTKDGSPVTYEVLKQKVTKEKDAKGEVKDKIQYVSVKFNWKGGTQTVTADLTGSPSGAKYERTVKWGNDLTDHLNKIGYLGKTDWEPMQVQAMGWMRILRQYGRPEEDIQMALDKNTARISAEVNFNLGPQLVKDFPKLDTLPLKDQEKITKSTLEETVPQLVKLMDLQGEIMGFSYGPGVYGGEVNPSGHFGWLGSKQSAAALTTALAYVSEQQGTARVVFGLGGQNNRALVIRKDDGTEFTKKDINSLRDFAAQIREDKKHPLYKAAKHYFGWTKKTWEVGFSMNAMPGGPSALSYGLSDARADAIMDMMEAWGTANGVQLTLEKNSAESTLTENNWKDNPNGEAYKKDLNSAGVSRKVWESLSHFRRNTYPSILQQAYRGTKSGSEALDQRGQAGTGQTFQLVQATHWSRRGDLTELNPDFHGTGIPGAESLRRRTFPELYRNRIYFGLPGYVKEQALSDNEYPFVIDDDILYDIAKDPDGLWAEAARIRDEKYAPMDRNALITIFENLVEDAGYFGIRNTEAKVGISFKPIPLDGRPIDSTWNQETYQLQKGQQANDRIPDDYDISPIDELMTRYAGDVMAEQAEMDRQAELKALAENRIPLTKERGLLATWVLPVSSSIRQYAPEVFAKLREQQFQLSVDIAEAVNATLPFRKAVMALTKGDRARVGLLLSNQDHEAAREIVGNDEAFNAMIEVINRIGKRAKAAGFEFDFMKNYFPRLVRDLDGLFESFGKEVMGPITDALHQAELKNGVLSEEERLVVINSVLAGHHRGSSAPGFTKQRKIHQLTQEQYDKFYAPMFDALDSYIGRMIKAVSEREFFGKKTVWRDVPLEIDYTDMKKQLEGDADIEDFDLTGGVITTHRAKKFKVDLDKSVAAFVADEKLNPFEQRQLQKDLRAIFGYQATPDFYQQVRILSYLATMGSGMSSTITQLQDTAFAAFEGGVARAPASYFAAVFGISETKVERDLGLLDINQEYQDMTKLNKFLDKTFTATGLKHFGRAGQNSLVNAGLSRYRAEARRGTFSNRHRERLNEYFANDQNRIAQLKRDLAAGRMTSDVHLLGWNILADYHPIGLAEMPRGYLENPHGRMLYILKSFTVKQFDSYRREGYMEMRRGFREKDWGRFAKGFAKLSQLLGFLWLAGFPTDWIKDFVFNREPSWSTVMVDNVWKLGGMSRYTQYYAKQYGWAQTAFLMARPPTPFIDYPLRDVYNFFDDPGNFSVQDMQTWRLPPVAGQWYYWWVGGGHTQIEKQRERERKKSKKSKSSGL